MNYKELLELYRTGQLDDGARQQVEADIEKQDAISEFLCDQGDIPALEALPEPETGEPSEDSDRFTAAIRRSIRRAFLKMGIIVGAVVLVLTLAAIFVLPKAVDQFFYQPEELVGRSPESEYLTTSRLNLDLSVWTELFLPGRYRNNADTVSRGYGCYDVMIQQNSSADGRFETLAGRLERGVLSLYNPNSFHAPAGNAFFMPEGVDSFHTTIHVDGETGREIPMDRAEERKNAFDYLRSKPDHSLYIAYVSLEEVTPYAEFYRWYKALDPDGNYGWAGIYAEDEFGSWVTENTGVSLSPSGMTLDWDRERYPHLSLLDNEDPGYPDASDEALMTEHFLSLLRYLDDHPELEELFPDTICHARPGPAMAYVDEHGLQVYGFAIVAGQDDLLKLEHEPAVSYISTCPY